MMEKFNQIVYLTIILMFGWLLLACQPNAKNTEREMDPEI